MLFGQVVYLMILFVVNVINEYYIEIPKTKPSNECISPELRTQIKKFNIAIRKNDKNVGKIVRKINVLIHPDKNNKSECKDYYSNLLMKVNGKYNNVNKNNNRNKNNRNKTNRNKNNRNKNYCQ